MIPFLASAARWLLSGGWKYASMGLLALGLLFYRHEAHSWHNAFDAQRSAYVAAQAEATAKQLAANLATQARYRAAANETDTDHAKALVDADSAAVRYIAGHRLRASDQCPTSGTVAAAQGADPAVPSITAASPIMVVVESGDVMACTADHEYAVSAYEWGQRLIRDGLGE